MDKDKEKLKEAEDKLKLERDQELEDIKTILDLQAGIRFFSRLMERGSVFSSTFTGNSHTYFLEGKRSFALSIFNDLCEANPNKIAEIMIRKEES